MKRVYEVSVGALALAAAGLTVWSAAANKLPVFGEGGSGTVPGDAAGLAAATGAARVDSDLHDKGAAPAGDEGGASGAISGLAARVQAAESVAEGKRATEETHVPVPEDLRVTVKKSATGSVISVRRARHVVALLAGRDRRVGLGEVTWAARSSEPSEPTKLVWETTHEKTLETIRGELTWSGGDAKVAVENATLRAPFTGESSAAHVCKAHDDGAGGFVVVCRVNGVAAAAAVDGDDPKRGVWSQVGDSTLVRFDLPMAGDGVDTRVIGYENGGKGTIVRVEASRAPGEAAPVLAILSDGRDQPSPSPRLCCVCMIPPSPSL